MPSRCLQTFASLQGKECPGVDCQGFQRDGGCLLGIVRRANAQGLTWVFEVDRDGYWIYAGPPLR
jgi:hypothetical protein